MTYGQILTFTIIARYHYALYSARVVTYGVIGDPVWPYHRTRLILANALLKRLKCYDPDAENNCLTEEQVYTVIQQLMQLLGMCGDPQSLAESDTTCCSPIAGYTILNP